MAKNENKDNKNKSTIIEGMTDEEVYRLQEEAKQRYINEIVPAEKEYEEEMGQKFDKMISTTSMFRKRFNEDNFKFQFIYQDDLYAFQVKPVEPGDDMSYLEVDVDIYSMLDEKERKVIEKVAHQEKLRPFEEKIMENINKKQRKIASSELLTMSTKLLASHLMMENDDGVPELLTEEDLKWTDFVFKVSLADIVKTRLGIDANTTMELFRPGGQS